MGTVVPVNRYLRSIDDRVFPKQDLQKALVT